MNKTILIINLAYVIVPLQTAIAKHMQKKGNKIIFITESRLSKRYLKKKKIELTKFEIHLNAEEAMEHPKIFTKIHIEFIFQGKELDSKQLERAIYLSQNKYCPITQMLKPSVEITTSYKIIT